MPDERYIHILNETTVKIQNFWGRYQVRAVMYVCICAHNQNKLNHLSNLVLVSIVVFRHQPLWLRHGNHRGVLLLITPPPLPFKEFLLIQ